MSGTLDSLLRSLIVKDPPQPKVYSSRILSNQTKQLLLSYQHENVIQLIRILATKHIAIDTSDTGVGKTYMAAAICKEMGRKPIIICPKTLIFNWQCILDFFGVKAFDIVNYETIRTGKTYHNNKYSRRIKAPYLNKIEPNERSGACFEWILPQDTIVIFDEVHRCKDPVTENGKLLYSTKSLIKSKTPVLLLSATICEKISDMKIPLYLMERITSIRDHNEYVRNLFVKYPQHRVRRRDYFNKDLYIIARDNKHSLIIYDEIQEFTRRIRIKDLGSNFPSNQWCAQQFVADEPKKIAQAHAKIARLMEELRNNPGSNILAQIQKLKQEIEMRKVPIFIEQANLHLDEGKSVIIFVNYLDSLELIAESLSIVCRIHGSQTMKERQEMINLFQSNTERIIICQIRAGGTGISLHDLDGRFPRVTLINYPDRASDLLQALGRAPRSGAKSPVLQRIIFVANVEYEKKIMQNINRKLTNISAINDRDLDGYKYRVKKISRKENPQ